MKAVKKYWWLSLVAILLPAAYILYWKQKKGELLKPGYNKGQTNEKFYKRGKEIIVQCAVAPCPPMYEQIEVTKKEATWLGFLGI